MDLNQITSFIVDLLKESDRSLRGIYGLDVAGSPAKSSLYIIPVSPASVWQFLPVLESPFIRTTLLFVQGGGDLEAYSPNGAQMFFT